MKVTLLVAYVEMQGKTSLHLASALNQLVLSSKVSFILMVLDLSALHVQAYFCISLLYD